MGTSNRDQKQQATQKTQKAAKNTVKSATFITSRIRWGHLSTRRKSWESKVTKLEVLEKGNFLVWDHTNYGISKFSVIKRHYKQQVIFASCSR
jgi:hypothetical protein